MNWVRFVFATEQKKTDFRPELDAAVQMSSAVSVLQCVNIFNC